MVQESFNLFFLSSCNQITSYRVIWESSSLKKNVKNPSLFYSPNTMAYLDILVFLAALYNGIFEIAPTKDDMAKFWWNGGAHLCTINPHTTIGRKKKHWNWAILISLDTQSQKKKKYDHQNVKNWKVRTTFVQFFLYKNTKVYLKKKQLCKVKHNNDLVKWAM